MGSAGVLFTELGATISNVHVHHIPAITVDVVDTTVSQYCVHALIQYIYCRVLVMHLLVLWHIIYRGIPV